MQEISTQVLIIGGGATGTGVARDLALRGVACVVVEQGDLNAGASGANHGLLHSGGRYVFTDPGSARECMQEALLLKQLAPDCIEDTGGLFVAVPGDDEKFVADFPTLCQKSDIPVRILDVKEARHLEPALSPALIAAYQVPDAVVDPFQLTLENMYHARKMGARLYTFSRVTGFESRRGRVIATRVRQHQSDRDIRIIADHVVNAAGAWAGEVAALAGITIHILYSKGSLIITHNRLTKQVVNRLRPSANADILVPGGTVSILGTTSVRIPNLKEIRPTIAEVDAMVEEATAMIPALEQARFIRAFAGVRPLVSSGAAGDDRAVSRSFALLDHGTDGVENMTTISGGKLTTFRLMAEKTADQVCARLGVTTPCATRTTPYPAATTTRWSWPARAPEIWLREKDPHDTLLCECEMVPKSTVDEVVADLSDGDGWNGLQAVGLRTRVGKGGCQGTFCGARTTTHLYEQGVLKAESYRHDLTSFLEQRWKGQHSTLWDRQLAQADLLEAMYCGFFGLEHSSEHQAQE